MKCSFYGICKVLSAVLCAFPSLPWNLTLQSHHFCCQQSQCLYAVIPMTPIYAELAPRPGRMGQVVGQLTTSRSSARIARLLRLLIAAFAKVISSGVDDDGTLSTMLEQTSLSDRHLNAIWHPSNFWRRHTPMTLFSPINLTCESLMLPLPFPCPSVLKLPRSPTWRISSEGAPWVFWKGLTMQELRQLRPVSLVSILYGVGWRSHCSQKSRDITYSGDQQMCNRWCYRRTGGRGFLAQRWGHCR